VLNKIVEYYQRARTFVVEVRQELKKVTWPPRKEVYATTIVVVIAVFFFGFYLYGLDLIMSYAFSALTRLIGGA
jgi:preprotein translocase subunit SecE